MPLYDYKCDECGTMDSEFRSLATFDDPKDCPICGKPMVHDLVAQQAAVRGNYKKPIVSDALGFVADPETVAEHRQKFPEIDLDMSEGSARPVFRSLGQKRKYLKAVGWADTKSY